MLEERQNEQTKLATKKGRKSSEKFSVGEKLILRETTETKRQWLETGVIIEQRISDDGSFHSFIIDLDKGGQCLRKKRFLNDDVTHDPPYMNMRSRSPIP